MSGPSLIWSPHVRESMTVLGSKFHTMDSLFQLKDSGFQSLVRFRIPWAVFWIPQAKITRIFIPLDEATLLPCHWNSWPEPLLTTKSAYKHCSYRYNWKNVKTFATFRFVGWKHTISLFSMFICNHCIRVKQFSTYFTSVLRDLKQARRPQRRREKKQEVLRAKEYAFIWITIFGTFLWRPLHDDDVKLPDTTNSPFFF